MLQNAGMTRRSFLGATASAAALLGLGLVGCGKPADKASEVKANKDATITIAAAYKTKNFHPSNTSSALACGTNWHVVEGLYGIDFRDYSVHKELAADDEPTKVDDTTFEIKLRKDAKFSNGNPVKPEDVVKSFERSTAEGNIYIPMLSPIESITKKDDNTVTVKTKFPFELLKQRLSIIRVVPADVDDKTLTAMPIGSGPWAYEKVDGETQIIAKPNKEYNGPYPAGAGTMQWDVQVDATARKTAFSEGTDMIMESIPAEDVDTIKGMDGVKVDQVQGFGLVFMMMNAKHKPFDNVKVRQACRYALDVDKMIKNTFAGQAAGLTCYLPENHTNYHKASTVYTHDVEKAKALLKEAGYTPGKITLSTTDSDFVVSMSAQVQQDLEAIGFKVEIQKNQSSAMYSAIDQDPQSYDIALAPGDASCFGNDPDLLMSWYYGNNTWTTTRTQWADDPKCKEVQDLLAQAVQKGGKEQQDLWNKCFDIIAEYAPLYPVLHKKVSTAYYAEKIADFGGISTTGVYAVGAKAK